MSPKRRKASQSSSFLPKLRLDQYLSLFFVGFVLLTLPIFWRNKQIVRQVKQDFNLVQIGDVPFLKKNLTTPKQTILEKISAKNLIVIDVESATILLEKNATKSAFPASTTKMMTAIIVQENLDQDQILTVNKKHLINGNKLGFVIGEKVRVGDLLRALLISSSNEAADILASGTARDLGVLARELMKDEVLRQIVATKEFTFLDTDQKFKHIVTNTNQLLHENAEVVGIKTGTTDGAGEVLVTQVEREVGLEKRKVIIVLMGSLNRYADTTVIMDWVFDSYDWVDLNLDNLLE